MHSFLALFAIAIFPACSHDKQEAGAVIHAVEQFRAAPDEGKTLKVAELTGVTCSTQEICDVKLECLKWAEPTAKALAIKVQAANLLADVKNGKETPDDPNIKSLPDQLDLASKLLEEGHAELQPCEEKLTGLRIKYRL